MSATKEPEWHEHTVAESVVCPYCGADQGSDDYSDGGEEECYKCKRTFEYDCEYSVAYTTRRKEDTR